MATITLKNIPEPVYKTIKELAAEHHRSINSQIIYLIEKATKSTKIDPQQHLILARTLREKTSQYVIEDRAIAHLKNEGRS